MGNGQITVKIFAYFNYFILFGEIFVNFLVVSVFQPWLLPVNNSFNLLGFVVFYQFSNIFYLCLVRQTFTLNF